MKNILLILVLFTTLTNAQTINFTDINLKNKLLEANTNNNIAFNTNYQAVKIDINNDGEIQISEALLIKHLNISNTPISSFDGLTNFVNLKNLSVQNTNMSNFNLSGLNQLETLDCGVNQLTTLNLSLYPNLKGLSCSDNQISTLNLSSVPNLEKLSCENNQITSLDFRSNPNFYYLSCKNNNISTIFIKNNLNQNLSYSWILNDCWSNNPLSYICADASETAALQSFLTGCGYNLANITIDSNCALSEHSFSKNVVKVFPNPSNTGVFSVELPVVSKGKAMVYNALGQKVYENTFVNQTFTLPLNFLPKGTYFLKLITENQEVFERKLVVN